MIFCYIQCMFLYLWKDTNYYQQQTYFFFSLSLFICPFFFHTFSSATRMMQTSRKYLLIYTCVYDISKIQCMWCQNFCICFYLFINQDCIHRGFTNKQPLKPAWSPLLIFELFYSKQRKKRSWLAKLFTDRSFPIWRYRII